MLSPEPRRFLLQRLQSIKNKEQSFRLFTRRRHLHDTTWWTLVLMTTPIGAFHDWSPLNPVLPSPIFITGTYPVLCAYSIFCQK